MNAVQLALSGGIALPELEKRIKGVKPDNYDRKYLREKLLLAIQALRYKHDDKSNEEIGQSLGISPSWIRDIDEDYILDELTRLKNIPDETPFFVKRVTDGKVDWIDINTDREYELLDIPVEEAEHGLCEKYGRKVIKMMTYEGDLKNKTPIGMVLIAKDPEQIDEITTELMKKKFTVPFINADKIRGMWTFDTPLEIQELVKGIKEDLTDKELCIRLGCPREAVKNVRKKVLAEMEVIERKLERIGGDKKKDERGDKNITIRRVNQIKQISRLSGNI